MGILAALICGITFAILFRLFGWAGDKIVRLVKGKAPSPPKGTEYSADEYIEYLKWLDEAYSANKVKKPKDEKI